MFPLFREISVRRGKLENSASQTVRYSLLDNCVCWLCSIIQR